MPFIKRQFIQNSLKLFGDTGQRWLLVGLVASVGIALVELSVSIIIQLLLIRFGFLSNPPTIAGVTIPSLSIYLVAPLLCAVAVIRFFVQLTSTQTSAFIRDHISHRLRKNSVHQMLFSHSLNAHSPSAINFKISEIFVKSSEFVFNFSLFLSMLVQSLFLFLIMFFVAWKESCIALLGVVIIAVTVLFINKNVSKYAKKVPQEQRKLNEGIEKIARNFFFIKLMKKRTDEYHSIVDAITEYSSKSLSAHFFSNLGAQVGPFLGIFLLVCIILISQSLWHSVPLTLISFIYLLARFVQSLSILSSYFGNAITYLPQYQLCLESIQNSDFQIICKDASDKVSFLGRRSYMDSQPFEQEQAVAKFPCESQNIPNIVFKNVTFSYSKSHVLFKNINFEIQAGSQIGIVGASGTGKSTLLMLITGMLEANAGLVYVGGEPAPQFAAKPNIRMGYVGVEPFLIKGTLKENVCYGLSKNITEEEIQNAFKLVSLETVVFEKGLNYGIEENQSGLSAGQKQRLCLARAILNKPCLLILDEATANLDEQNETMVAHILNSLKKTCTTIIVSHRPGILVFADKIIEMNQLLGSSPVLK